ncbi:hypothetical protein CAPTEDRAFT_198768 [Capitella teleta]|uniref:Uncharacterized protein n=1 Tax=Capitella teleta TaxID=283909 RepID=R7V435_CAPTE|nr:hypothetical protein CAPTEDRAFT_198768 [Capitella teleta]|eukprot:ELU13324.1 hypothetical protein CAPTEDRAFT_198768 [Capitella teleta]
MLQTEELHQLKSLLQRAIQRTCVDNLKLTTGFKLDAVIAITPEDNDAVVVNINENFPQFNSKRIFSDDEDDTVMMKRPKKDEVKPEGEGPEDECDDIGCKIVDPEKQSNTPTMLQSSKLSNPVLSINRQATLAQRIITFPGPYAPIRSVQRRNGTFSSANISLVMREMTVSPQSPRYVGEFKELAHESRPIRVFYKRPPDAISTEALGAYGISTQAYKDAYYSELKAYLRDHSKDMLYRDMLKHGSPYKTF